jgi:phosphohistidine phosphatase SixA
MTSALILTRHGHYRTASDQLSERGRAQMADIGEQLADHDIIPARIYHSGLPRTESAAQILSSTFAARAGQEIAIEAARWLQPFEPSEHWQLLSGKNEDILHLVTHEPNVKDIAAELTQREFLRRMSIANGETFVIRQEDPEKGWRNPGNLNITVLKPRT